MAGQSSAVGNAIYWTATNVYIYQSFMMAGHKINQPVVWLSNDNSWQISQLVISTAASEERLLLEVWGL